MLESGKSLVVVTVTLDQEEGSPVPNDHAANAENFIKALDEDEALRKTISIQDSVVKVAKLWTHDHGLTAQDLEKALENKWGHAPHEAISKFCFSEVPGF